MWDPSRIISAGVGPIIVISACGLLCLAFYSRLSAVVTRLRAFHRERLAAQELLTRARSSDPINDSAVVRQTELIGMLEIQTRHVHHRAQMIRRTLTCLLLAIAMLAGCSLCVGLGTIQPGLFYVAVPLFIVGLLALIVAIVFALIEMNRALDPVELESRFVQTVDE